MIETEPSAKAPPITRRALLKGAGGAAGMAVVGAGAYGAIHLLQGGRHHRVPRLFSLVSPAVGGVRHFVSRPDLRPPAVSVSGGGVGPGYVCVIPGARGGAQAGPLIIDNYGEPVWFSPISLALWATNFRVARYQGKPVLTWWEGRMTVQGYGRGEGVIADSSYREVARVRAGNGRHIDMHEFHLTPQGTALFTCYPQTVPADLSSIGGPVTGSALETIIQEVDVRSGRVLLEWRALEHVGVEESYQRPASPYDYLHGNSVAVTPDGNLLVSARCTWALYKLDRQTGRVLWRLGGKRSDFQMEDGTQFSWQHDARQVTGSTITLFDDGNAAFDDGSGMANTESQSRGIVLGIDEARGKVRLVRAYRHPHPLLANAMGSVQTLPNGHVLVGWGSEPTVSEFTADGRLLADIGLGANHTTYRAFRLPWAATPAETPAIATRRGAARDQITVYASWNGATGVSDWIVRTGHRPGELQPVGIARRRGFETAIPLTTAARYVQVTALDRSGRQLASSRAIRV